MAKRPVPRIIAVAGGKGGVGKSTMAINLAFALSRLGMRVIMVDGDLGAANLHTMLGILNPPSGLADFHDGRTALLDQVAISIGPNVLLIPGLSRPGAANMPSSERLRLIKAICRLDCDVVIVDVGAGTSFAVVDLVAAADHKLFVVTPHLPSLHNAYAQLKACVHRVVRKLAQDDTEQSLIDAALGQENKARTITQLLSVLQPLNPTLADRISDVLMRFGVSLIGNQLGDDSEATPLAKMAPLIYDHLSVQAPLLVAIKRSVTLGGGLKAGKGSICSPISESGRLLHRLAQTLLEVDLASLRGEDRMTFQRTIPLWIMRDDRLQPSSADSDPAA